MSASDEALASMRAREAAVRGLLARIGTSEPDSAAFGRAWELCRIEPDEIDGWREALRTASASEHEIGRALLHSLATLHAVAEQAIERERTQVAELLDRTRRVRARLASYASDASSYASDATSGESCDVAG